MRLTKNWHELMRVPRLQTIRLRLRRTVHVRGAASLVSSVRDTRDARGQLAGAPQPAALSVFRAHQLSTSAAPPKPLLAEAWVRSMGWHTSQLPGQLEKRWVQVPLAAANHLCLGSVFAWSIFNPPLQHLQGVVVPSAADWVLGDITITFSLVMGGFAWGAIFGKYLDAWGTRVSCLVGAAGLGSGFGLAALASSGVLPPGLALPCLYSGGLVWGLANGFAYVPPVANLLQWFPSSKGFASGMCIAGYGSGAMLTSAAAYRLMAHFREAPTYIGNSSDVVTQTIDGVLFAESAAGSSSALTEVVVATAADVAKWADLGLEAGLYAVGTGSTGVTETFLILGSVMSTTMVACAFGYRSPPPASIASAANSAAAPAAAAALETGDARAPPVQLTTFNIAPEVSLRSPQFWLLYGGFGCAITGAYGILSSGTTMLNDGFGTALPGIVTPAFVAGYVSALSLGNLGGRIGWTTLSDVLARRRGGDPFYGRRQAYSLMWGMCPLLYGGVLWSIHSCAAEPNALALGVFTASTMGIISSFGGSAAMRPALWCVVIELFLGHTFHRPVIMDCYSNVVLFISFLLVVICLG